MLMKVKQLDSKTWYAHGYMIYKTNTKGVWCDCKDWMFKMSQKKPKDRKPVVCKHIVAANEQYPEAELIKTKQNN